MKLLLVVLEGQLYLAGVLAIFAAELAFLLWGLWSRRPIVGLVAVFAMAPLLKTTVSAIRACFVRIRPPEGVALDPTEGRALYSLADEVRRAVKAPPVDSIVITGDFAASAVEYVPRWRLRKRRALVLGFPALTTLSASELRAVVAHELAHFSSAHDAFAAWVYRTRFRWRALRASLDRRLATPVYVYWIAGWYVPRLDRASAEVARRHEFAADRVAAEVAGSRAVADALVAFEAGVEFAAAVHWPKLRASHETDVAPPRPYSSMLGWDARRIAPEALEALRAAETGPGCTHPSLRDRLTRLGEEPRMPPPARSAGEEILGGALSTLAARLDRDWLARHGESWTRRRAEHLGRLATVERLAAIERPTAGDLFEHAEALEDLDDDAALPLYRRAAAMGHAAASLAAGRMLLDRREADGIALVETAMDLDERLVPDGCRMLAEYYRETGQLRTARQCERRADRYRARGSPTQPTTPSAVR